jgi:hypothetical protein
VNEKDLAMFLKLHIDTKTADYQIVLIIFFMLTYVVFAVRGMMYYKEALKLQAFLDMAEEKGW